MATSQPDLASDPVVDVHNRNHYKIGTLLYTKASLISLFLFLLWGDFCFSLMETVMPNLLPLQLNKIGAPNTTISVLLTTIPAAMTIFVNPVVSFRSDRFRSRWGRRIPFLAAATPFVVLFLILLGYAEPISKAIHHYLLGGRFSDLNVILVVVGILMVGFQFFNSFINSTYYYLFNDVVPRAFLARMMAFFRIVGTGAGAVYQYFIFEYSDSHMAEIFVGAALLYLVGFTVMCWKVKEGEYPPPPENLGNEKGFIGAIKTYALECFTHRFYWLLFLANAAWSMTWVTGPFGTLLSTEVMGFDRAFIGHVAGISMIVGMILLLPAGYLADRYHPLRVMLLGIAGALVLMPLEIILPFVRHHLSLETAQNISMGLAAIKIPINTIASAGEVALFMRILPQDRYGQFCSANALFRSLALIVGGLLCGAFLDYVKIFGTVPSDCYRFVPVWNGFFQFWYVFFYYLVYREWNRLGGLKNFVPPSAKPSASVLATLS